MAATCIFCGATGKLTREHVWPQWLGTVVTPKTGQHVFAEAGTTTREFTQRDFEIQVKKVCEDCNGGWMSQMEAAVKPVLTPMIKGEHPVLVSAADQELLTAWATKTAMTMEFAPTAQRAIPQVHRDYIQQTHRAPPRVKAWIGGRSAGTSIVRYDYQRIGDDQPDHDDDGYGVMIAVGGVFIHLLSLPTSLGSDPVQDPGIPFDPTGALSHVMTRITPARRGDIPFPPPTLVDEQELDGFFAGLTGRGSIS